jgi:hypothetical protein
LQAISFRCRYLQAATRDYVFCPECAEREFEELDPGDAGERVFDTLLGRLSDPRGPRKLLAVANPAGLVSWQYRRLIEEATRDPGVARVHFTLADNAANLPADYLAAMDATRLTRPHWYASFIDGRWGAFEGMAFEEFSDQVHVVEPFEIPASWERFESMDHLFKSCTHLIAQLKSAPVAEDGIKAGEVVDPKWASAHGHAVDAARYGAISRPSPSDEPQPSPHLEDERAEALRQWYQREREEQRQTNSRHTKTTCTGKAWLRRPSEIGRLGCHELIQLGPTLAPRSPGRRRGYLGAGEAGFGQKRCICCPFTVSQRPRSGRKR